MKTYVMPAEGEAIERGAQILREGGLVAFPTETVYGLGANALDGRAVKSIFEAKGRPGDNPLIVHISALSQLDGLIAGEMPDMARRLAQAYWPGPLTMIFPKGEKVPSAVTAGLDTVAVRFPNHPAALALIEASGLPIAAPSANRSGRPSPTAAAHVLEDMDGRIPLILDGGPCGVGLESTVADVTGDIPRVLRPGGVTPEMLAEVAGAVEVDGAVLRPLREGEKVRSPGMKYRHYAPQGALTIVEGEPEKVAQSICRMYDEAGEGAYVLALAAHTALYGKRRVLSLGENVGEAASRLFDALRQLDSLGAKVIFSEAVAAEGLGLAVMNRLGRAAAFHVIRAE